MEIRPLKTLLLNFHLTLNFGLEMAFWKGRCGCMGLRCLTCSDGVDKVSGQTAKSGSQEMDNTLIERGESWRKCLLRKIQWVCQKNLNPHVGSSYWLNFDWNKEEIILKHTQWTTLHDYIWKYQYFKWQISQAAMPAGRWGLREILPVLVCHLPAPGKYFFFLLLIAQSVSMRLMLYVRFYPPLLSP